MSVVDHQARFDAFLEKHPEAYPEFCKRVKQLMGRGIKHYSADAICHIIRFHSIIDERKDGQPFKFNNNHVKFLSRMWIADHPEYPDFFSTRERKQPYDE